MKHATFENELREIRRMAINELKEALKAHGRRITFDESCEPNLIDGTRILAAECYGTTLVSFTMLLPNGETEVGKDDSLYIEDILAITEAIPETNDVKDVSGVYPVPVAWVDTDDIEMQGFKTEGMTQEDLQKVADEMCDIYNNGDFCSDLDLACKNLKLKEKEG